MIGKQIAFLSKETEGQPDKVLAVGTNNNNRSASSASAERHCQRNVSGNVNSSRRDEDEDDSDGGTPAALGGRVGDGAGTTATAGEGISSPLGAPFAARVEFFRRLRRGLVTANELLPESMLSLSATTVSGSCRAAPPPGDLPTLP